MRLPYSRDGWLESELLLRILRLNCLTTAWGDLWEEAYDPAFIKDSWAAQPHGSQVLLQDVSPTWTRHTPLRLASERRQALVEIDAMVALLLGLTADELCTIYRTQFSVLYGYDRKTYFYDANGRLVPNSVLTVWRKKGDAISEEERTAEHPGGATYTYQLPFVTLDREADMRRAYAHFEQILKARS